VAAYYFPPYADVSGTRAAKFCKYLPRHGWIPHVLTVDPRYYGTKVLPSLLPGVKGVKRTLVPYLRVPGRSSLVKLLYPLAVVALVWRRRRSFDAVYLCGSPFHPFMVTAIVTRVLKMPTILDFRDSWSLNAGFDADMYSRKWSPKKRIESFVKRQVERIGIRYASRVSFVTVTLTEQYATVFPEYSGKFLTIPNGFDPDDLTGIQPHTVGDRRELIVLSGKFLIYGEPTVRAFLHSLSRFDNLQFVYIGTEHKEIADLANALGVKNQVFTIPYSPYGQVLSLVAGADYGLLTHGLAYAVGTKIFDYIALRKPTLCLVPTGSAVSREFGAIDSVVIVESPHTVERIVQALAVLLGSTAAAFDTDVEKFSRVHAAGSLARTLEEIADRNSADETSIVSGKSDP